MIRFLCSFALVVAPVILAACNQSEPPPESRSTADAPPAPATPKPGSGQLPHYYEDVKAAQPFPKTLPPDSFSNSPVIAEAYHVARTIPEVLALQPCYCHCDSFGHGSLLDCYATEHGAGCAICLKEVLLADRMTREGSTPEQVRQAIIDGHWKAVELGGPGP